MELGAQQPAIGPGATMASEVGARTVFHYVGEPGLARLSVGATATSPDGAAFRARVTSIPLGSTAVEEVVHDELEIERTAVDIERLPLDLVRIQHMMRGSMNLDNAGEALTIGEGETIAFPMDQPFSAVLRGRARHVSLLVPSRLLKVSAGVINVLGREPLTHSAALSIFTTLLRVLPQVAPMERTTDAALLSHALVDLARGAVGAPREDDPGGDPREQLRNRVYAIIELEYTDPQLRGSVIASRLSVSARNLQRLFAREPLSIAKLIRLHRVEAAARELVETQLPFEAIARAVGFGSVDSAYRSFRDEMGLSPTEYRRSASDS